MEKFCPQKIHIRITKQKLAEMANNTEIDISNLTNQISEASIGGPLIMTLYLTNRAFQTKNHCQFQLCLFRKN